MGSFEKIGGTKMTAEQHPQRCLHSHICKWNKDNYQDCIDTDCASHRYTYGNNQQSEHLPDLSHIAPGRRGCLTCLDPTCPVWQAADQNCWKSLADHNAAIRKDEREKVLDEVRDQCSASMQKGSGATISGIKLSYILSDLRSKHGGEQG